MPTPAIPSGAQGPYGEPIVSVISSADPNLHLPQITYYGRANDIPLIQNIVTGQIPANSILGLATLQSYAVLNARVAIIVQYDPGSSDHDAGIPMWVSDDGAIIQNGPTNNSIGGMALYEGRETNQFSPDRDEPFDIVIIIDAQNIFDNYGLRDSSGNPTEAFRGGSAFYLTLHELLHPRRGDHREIAAQPAGTLTAQFLLDHDPIYSIEFQAAYNLGITVADASGQLRDPRAPPGSPQYISLPDYMLLLAQRMADLFNNGSSQIVLNGDPGLTLEENANLAEQIAAMQRAVEQYIDQLAINEIENAGQWGRQFASILGRVLPIDDPFERTAASALIATIGENLAEAISVGGISTALPSGRTYNILSNAFEEFGTNLISGGIGTISSILVADLIDSLGLEGTVAGDLGQSAGAQYLSAIITNLPGIASGATEFADVINGVNPAMIVATYLGTEIANEIHEFETVGGQIGAAVGAAYGAYEATAVYAAMLKATSSNIYAFVAAVIVIVIDTLLGGYIGSSLSGNAKAGAGIGWSEGDQRFEVQGVWSKNNGSKDAVRAMASHVGELLNGVIAMSGAHVFDAAGVQTGAYDQKNNRFIYKPSMEAGYAFKSKDIVKVINHGAFIALSDLSERLLGGDVYVKRALSATLAQASGSPESYNSYAAGDFETEVLVGNFAIARDYATYLQNSTFINALIAAEPESAFTAGWIVTFARAMELGLDRRWKSDWVGGWAAFLDETAGGVIDGVAFLPANVFLELDPATGERLFAFVDNQATVLGVLGDTIDTASKDVIAGTAGADAIALSAHTWTETRTFTETVTVSAERTFFNRLTDSIFHIDPEDVFQGDPIPLGPGLVLTGATTVEVTREITISHTGWRVAETAGLTLNGEAASGGPSDQIRVAALIDGGAGDDTIRGGDLGNDLIGGEGNDTLIGGALDDWQFGGEGNDRLFAGDVASVAFSDTATDATNEAARDAAVAVDGGNGDYLDGGEGDDAIYGGRGSDWLNGGDGVDVLRAGDGGDILDGGAGDDRGASGEARLLGGAGSDQYVFYEGMGHDTIFDASDPAAVAGVGLFSVQARYAFLGDNPGARNWAGDGDYEVDGSVVGGEDAISFGPGIGMEDLILRRGTGAAGADLVIAIALRAADGTFIRDANGERIAGPDSLTIKDWYDETRRVEWFRFADGQDVRIGDLSSFITGSDLGDSIVGTDGNDWVVGLGGGDDIALLDGDDFGFGGKGDDIVSGDGDEDFVSGGDDDDVVSGGLGHDTVFGDAGNDQVSGDAGNDIVAGGRGNDIVSGGSGLDLYRFWRGDGHDTMFDSHSTAMPTEVVYQDGQWVNGWVEAEDGRVSRGNDVLYDGETWNSMFQWDSTNRRLYRLSQPTSGPSTVNSGAGDMLEFGFGIDIEDVLLQRNGAHLELAIAGPSDAASAFMTIADRITFQDWFSVPGQIETFVFVETGNFDLSGWTLGATTGAASDGDDQLFGAPGSGRDWITGGLGDDTIIGYSGDDILSGNHGADRLVASWGKDVLFGGAGNDVIEGGGDADLIFGGAGHDIASYAGSIDTIAGVRVSLAHALLNTRDAAGDQMVDIEGLEGTGLNDELWGDAGDNTLAGLAGNDILKGDLGDDTYEVNAGQGDDIIADHGVKIEEIVNAAGVLNPGYNVTWQRIDPFGSTWRKYQLTVTRASDDAVVYRSRPLVDFIYEWTGPGEENYAVPPPAAWPFANGQWLLGGRTGNGYQSLIESIEGGDAGHDTLELGQNISLDDIQATRTGSDLRLAFAGGGSVTIQNHFYAEPSEQRRERAVEELVLHDGLAANLANVRLAGETAGSNADDLFLGASNNDTFAGGEGDDVLSGAAGNDILAGGDGDDTLEGGAGVDSLNGGADSVTNDHAALEGNALGAYGDTIRYAGSQNAVQINLGTLTASGGDAQGDTFVDIENVVGSDAGDDTLIGDDDHNRLAGLGGADALDGGLGDDVLMGGAGIDTLTGGDGDDGLFGGDDRDVIMAGSGEDSVEGGAGDDEINGGDDADQLSGDSGLDTVHGEGGDDVVVGGSDMDWLYGDAGNDTLAGGEGIDRLHGGAGDDVYLFDANSGIDQIIDAEGANNVIAFTEVSFEQLWITRSGEDLRIGVIGSGATVIVVGYYATPSVSQMRMIVTESHTLYLAHAADLIDAMTAHAEAAPDAIPAAIADDLAIHWESGEGAAPRVAEQNVVLSEDGQASGAIATIDPDDQALSYDLQQGPAHGTLEFNDTNGAWTYRPAANWNGVDGFDVTVTDEDGSTAVQHVTLNVTAVNDAPSIDASSLSVAENAPHGTIVGSLSATDLEGDSVTFEQTSTGGPFAVSATGQITVVDGAQLNFEGGASYQVQVMASNAGGATNGAQAITITLTDVNEAPTALGFANAAASLAESTSTAMRVKIADLIVTDDALGVETFVLAGADVALFEIFEGALYVKAGAALDFETRTSYQVTVTVDDATVGAAVDASQTFTLGIADANEAPTALAFNNITGSISDTASTANRIHVADLAITDDALGSEALGLTGPDAASFEIHNGALYLRAGVSLNAAMQSTYAVSVTVDDSELGAGAELTVPFTLNVGAGLALSFDNVMGTLPESTPTATRVKVADLVVADDVGTPVLGLVGADASAFEIYDGDLYLRAGTALNYESKTTYQVTVTLDDASVGSGVDLTRDFTLTIGDANEAPTAVTLTNTTTVLAENASTAMRVKVADLAIADDALGSESFGLSGADAAAFEIVGSALYLKAGVVLNYEAKSSYSVNVTVDDPTIGAAPDIAQAFTLSIADVNEAPASLSLTNTMTSLAESTSTVTRIKVADLVIADDALGSETIALTGADASSFEIYNGALYLKAGVALNYEAKASYAVTVTVDDPTVGATPDLSQAFTLSINDVNEAPSAVSFANTTTTVAENTPTGNRIKVADIVVADDALGAETLSLSGADAASFEIDGAVLYLKAGAVLNREAKSSYSVTVNVNDASVGATPDAAQSFTLAVSDVNEPVSLNWAGSSAQVTGAVWTASTHTLAVPETVSTGVTIGRIAASDLDVGAFANFRFELTGANAGLFTINAVTGDIALATPLNYEAAAHTFSVGITVWDGGAAGAGLSASGTITIDALNVNEAPVGAGFSYYYAGARTAGTTVGTAAASDPEGSAVTYAIHAVSRDTSYDGEITTTSLAASTYTITAAGVVKLNASVGVAGGRIHDDTITIRLSDAQGNVSYVNAQALYDGSGGGGGPGGGGGGVIPPVVLDLNGDGVTLVPFADSPVEVDANDDGLAEPIGWVGADDGFLALDRNGDGAIAGLDEIMFSRDVSEAVSDLEGLSAYDTNANGFIDAGDAQFAEFRVWQDANQDGVAQAGEVTDLAGRQISAINLTLTLTGQSPNGATDNVLYGTTSYVRTDGTTGLVGDVFLHYVPTVMESYGLPPIVFDLDGGGITLTSRHASSVRFDADNDGELERTGWFGAGEGVLALDRNGDGLIGSGAEISFAQDVFGALSDLEGLVAYDSNANGFFDVDDARFGDFLIWQDSNQDGISQAAEQRSLSEWNIVAVNLTLSLTGASISGATDNVIYATTSFVRGDGTRGTVGDVFLSFDEGVSDEPTPTGDDTPDGLRCLTPDPTGGVKTPHGAETDPSVGGDDTPGGVRCLTPDPNGEIKPPGGGQPDPLPRGPFGFSNAQDFLALLDAYREGLIPRERFGLRNLLGLFGDQGGQEEAGEDDVAWCGTTPDKTPDQSGGDGFAGPGLGAAGEGIGDVDRTAHGDGARRQSASGAAADPLGWISANELPLSAADPAEWLAELAEASRRVVREHALSGVQPLLSDGEAQADGPEDELFVFDTAASASQLHRRLGLADRRVLHMIDAMAGFEATSASDLARSSRQRDPKVAAMLTALPDVR